MAAMEKGKAQITINLSNSGDKAESSAAAASRNNVQVALAIAAYATASSLMLIVNKLAVHFLPAPGTVLTFQLFTTAATVWMSSQAGIISAEPLEWAKLKPFLLVVFAFLGAVFTNLKVLQYANVDTFIVFRSSTPIVISVLDYLCLGRQLPTLRSWASLILVLCGAVGYVMADAEFEMKAYSYVAAWYVVFCFDQLYIKHVCDTVAMSNWGRVYYTNSLAIPPAIFMGLLYKEHVDLGTFDWNSYSVLALVASCLCGVGMSYSQFWLRGLVSATSFTVVGICCKFATIIINCLMWDKHSSPMGLVALFVCLSAGTAYQQAPLRESKTIKSIAGS